MPTNPDLGPATLDVIADDISRGWELTREKHATHISHCALALAAKRRWGHLGAIEVTIDSILLERSRRTRDWVLAWLGDDAVQMQVKFDNAKSIADLPAPATVTLHWPEGENA